MNDLIFFCVLPVAFLMLYLLLRKRPDPERHGVKISKATGGAYADIREVVESELERIRRKGPQK